MTVITLLDLLVNVLIEVEGKILNNSKDYYLGERSYLTRTNIYADEGGGKDATTYREMTKEL